MYKLGYKYNFENKISINCAYSLIKQTIIASNYELSTVSISDFEVPHFEPRVSHVTFEYQQ